MSFVPPRRAALGIVVAGALLLSGCAASGTTATSDTSSDGAFPVTIESALGSAVIPAKPERVITLGWGSADTAQALGVTPIGVEIDSWAGDADGYQPWFRTAVEESGEELPTVITMYPELDLEAVLALDPDLILAPNSGLTPEQYDALAAFAPTVAYPDQPWSIDWDAQITTIGEALGEPTKAAGLITGINDTLADAAASHPQYDGVSFAYVYAAEPGALPVYPTGDARVDIISSLGFELSGSVAELTREEGSLAADLGLERADTLNDVDVLLSWYNDDANRAEIEAQPLFAQIPAVRRGSSIANVDTTLSMAMSLITPLTIPYALESYLPRLDAAVAAVG